MGSKARILPFPLRGDPRPSAPRGGQHGRSMSEPRLQALVGIASLTGRREDNQDFAACQPAEPGTTVEGEIMAAVADGVSGARGGRVAAETSVRAFLDGYGDYPSSLGAAQAAFRCLDAINQWIHALGRRDAELAGMATTFSALILCHRQAHVLHVGDSRIYRLRGEILERLTEDHTLNNPNLDHVLYRAVGIEERLRSDSAVHALEAHDRFLLCTDGLHAVLRDSEIKNLLLQRQSPESTATELADLAFKRGSQDNITALVVDVVSLPPPDRSLLEQSVRALPVLDLPKAGQSVDGFELEQALSQGRYSSLLLARDPQNERRVVLKFPHPQVASVREYHEAFLREAWIGARVKSPWVAEIVDMPEGRQSRLYTVLPYYPGKTLEQRIRAAGAIGLHEGVALAVRLCKAIHALHRLRIVHRDIKPDNVMILEDGGLKLLDLGVARLPAWDEAVDAPIPGTASYMAPEQFHGERGNVSTDIFAAGVSLYRMFARGAYPYGEIEPFSTPRYKAAPRPLARHRPDLPAWLGVVLARALAVDPAERYDDIMELAYELENGLAQGAPVMPRKRPLYERNPLLFWKATALVLLLALLAAFGRLAGANPPPHSHSEFHDQTVTRGSQR